MSRAAEWRTAHPEETRTYAEWYRAEYRTERNLASREWRRRNPEKQKAAQAKWKAENPRYAELNREKIAATKLACHRRKPSVYRAISKRHKAAKRSRVPVWADLQEIARKYDEAQKMTLLTGVLWHVDHVLPLQGELVSGLHVHTNLQVLPWRKNLEKGNRYVPA